MKPTLLGDALRAARNRLIQALDLDPSVAGLEARALLTHVLNRPRAYLLAHPEAALTETDQARFETLLTRRACGEPIAYLTGHREFYGLNFSVTPDVLIPRPETELLVELALTIIPLDTPTRILDLGTGSGAIAITLAHHRPRAQITAIDASAPALLIARKNATQLKTPNISFMESNWFTSLLASSKFDLIVANPPYVAEHDPHLQRGDVRYEPSVALTSGADGLDAIRHIARYAVGFLHESGHLLFEHGYDQGEACLQWLDDCGYTDVVQHRDLNGQARISGGKKPLKALGFSHPTLKS